MGAALLARMALAGHLSDGDRWFLPDKKESQAAPALPSGCCKIR